MLKNLFSFALILSFTFSFAEIPQSEKQALYAIAQSVHNNYNWNEQTPVEEWTGISISNIAGNDHVTGLNIKVSSNGSNYTIDFSDKISNLLYLDDFSLSFGSSSARNIIFKLDFNHLIGLSHLTNLDLNASTLHNLNDKLLNADKISQLANLENLTIIFKDVNFKIPSSISVLKKLKKLYYMNELDSTYTPEIFQTLSLEDLSIINGIYNVTESANTIQNLNHLKSLWLNGNFDNLPDGFYNIPNLETLYINSPNYTLSDKISNYSDRLKNLSLIGVNYIYQPSIGSLVNLESLNLKSSHIFLYNFITKLQQLKTLSVESEGPIYFSSSVSQLTNLENLFVRSRNAPISDAIYTIPNLKLLLLNTNQNVSEDVGNLQKLEHIQVQFDGNITALPNSIGTIRTLKRVELIIDGTINQTKLTLPTSYFTNWPQLQQFWSEHPVEGNLTNRFINNSNLETLYFDSYYEGNIEGKLNLCQNPKLNLVHFTKNSIDEIDLRNNESISNGNLRRITFSESKISKFVVDDVNQFNNLVNTGKINIQTTTPNGYSVVTSSEPCQRNLSQNEVQRETTLLYPNPVKDILTFKTDKTIENIEITSLTGQKTKVESYNNKVNLANLPSGLYIITWSERGLYKMQKVLKK